MEVGCLAFDTFGKEMNFILRRWSLSPQTNLLYLTRALSFGDGKEDLSMDSRFFGPMGSI
jgi:hypothetical protein